MMKYHQPSKMFAGNLKSLTDLKLFKKYFCHNSATDKKQGDQTQFSPKKDSRKRKIDFILPIIFAVTPLDGWCYRVIDSSVIQ